MSRKSQSRKWTNVSAVLLWFTQWYDRKITDVKAENTCFHIFKWPLFRSAVPSDFYTVKLNASLFWQPMLFVVFFSLSKNIVCCNFAQWGLIWNLFPLTCGQIYLLFCFDLRIGIKGKSQMSKQKTRALMYSSGLYSDLQFSQIPTQ